MMQDVIQERPSQGVALVHIRHEEDKNVFTPELADALVTMVRDLGQDEDVHALVITGYGNYFASGGSRPILEALQQGKGSFADSPLYELLVQCPVPVLTAMQGHGIGGGLAFGLSSDIAILAREGVYKANFMEYGFTPGMGATAILKEKFGDALATEMLFTAKAYRGAELAARGASCLVVPRAEVLPCALTMAAKIASCPRLSVVTLKDHLRRTFREQLPSVIEQEIAMHARTFSSPDVMERIKSYSAGGAQ
jgi:polyketide biosynthesis enoyl-CoA hydratase PksI